MLSEKPWKPEAVMLLLSALFFCLFLGLSAQFLVIQALPGLGTSLRKLLNFFTNIVAFHGMALVLVTLFLRAHRVGWDDFMGLRQRRLAKPLLAALAVGILLVPLALALNSFSAGVMKSVGITPELQPTIQVLQESEGVPKRLGFAFAAVLLAPVVEESLFRGILYPAIKQQGYPKAALFGTAVMFAAIHVNLMTFVPLTVFALVMVWLYEKSDTLLAPILAHCLFNACNFVMFIFEPELTDWFHRLV